MRVVLEGTGNAPSSTTLLYRHGKLEVRIREDWRPDGGEWEIRRREVEFVSLGLIEVFDVHPLHAPAQPSLSAPALAQWGSKRVSWGNTDAVAYDGCTEEEAESLCADKRLAMENAQIDAMNAYSVMLATCGGAILTSQPVAVLFLGWACANTVMRWWELDDRFERALAAYSKCKRDAMGIADSKLAAGPLLPDSRPLPASSGDATKSSKRILPVPQSTTISASCTVGGTPPGGGGGTVTCYYWVEYDLVTGEVYSITFMYCHEQ